jgi:hypothetical protein
MKSRRWCRFEFSNSYDDPEGAQLISVQQRMSEVQKNLSPGERTQIIEELNKDKGNT